MNKTPSSYHDLSLLRELRAAVDAAREAQQLVERLESGFSIHSLTIRSGGMYDVPISDVMSEAVKAAMIDAARKIRDQAAIEVHALTGPTP